MRLQDAIIQDLKENFPATYQIPESEDMIWDRRRHIWTKGTVHEETIADILSLGISPEILETERGAFQEKIESWERKSASQEYKDAYAMRFPEIRGAYKLLKGIINDGKIYNPKDIKDALMRLKKKCLENWIFKRMFRAEITQLEGVLNGKMSFAKRNLQNDAHRHHHLD